MPAIYSRMMTPLMIDWHDIAYSMTQPRFIAFLSAATNFLLALKVHETSHQRKEIKASQLALSERIAALERHVLSKIKPTTTTTTTMTDTLETAKTNLISRLLRPKSITMPGYFEVIMSIAVVGVLILFGYIAYVKDQENKHLRETAVAQAYQIGNLRRDLQQAAHTTEISKATAANSSAIADSYNETSEEHKAAAMETKRASDLAAQKHEDQIVDQILAFNELVNLLKEECTKTSTLVDASNADTPDVKKLVKDVAASLPRLEADAYRRGKDHGRSEILEELEGAKGM